MRRTRLVAVVILLVGIALVALPPTHVLSSTAALILIVAAIVVTIAKPSVAPAPSPALRAAEPPSTPKKRRESIEAALVATVTSAASNAQSMTDLHRILAGIISDERGRLVSSNGGPIVATFGTAAAAVHAAQRMVSNVDALGRRLDRLIALGVGIDNSIDEATRLEQLTHEKRIPVLVSLAAATVAENSSLALVDEGLYSFTPVQQRLF